MTELEEIKRLIKQFNAPGDFPAPLSNKELEAFGAIIGIELPNDLRDWLKISNGALVGTVPVYGLHRGNAPLSMERILRIFPLWRDRKWIPVAGDGCGNYYVMATQQEFGEGFPIVFVRPVSDKAPPRYIAASDLGHFLVFLMETELRNDALDAADMEVEPSLWFNKERALRDDPAILKFHGVPLPWEAG